MSVVPYTKDNDDNDFLPNLPYIPKGTSKVIFELAKLLIHDDRKDIWKFSYIGHPSKTHHWLWGGAGILASTLTGLLEKTNEMFEDVVKDADPNNKMEQDLINMGRFLQQKATQGVQELNYIAQHPPVNRTMIIEHYSNNVVPNPYAVPHMTKVPQQTIYMGKIKSPVETKKKALLPPPRPTASKKIPIQLPSYLANKGRPKTMIKE